LRRLTEVGLREFIDLLLRSIDHQVRECVRYGARCRDPPAVTTSMLKDLFELSEFRVKRFWKVSESLSRARVEVYRVRGSEFYITLKRRKGSGYVVNNTFFPDTYDCDKLRRWCVEVANVNELYLYLEGVVEGESMRVNVVFLMKKLAEASPKCYKNIMALVRALSLGVGFEAVAGGVRCLVAVLRRYRGLIADVLPVVPRSVEEALLISPALNRVFKHFAHR